MREGPAKCQGSREEPEINQIEGKGGNRLTKEVEFETVVPKCIGFRWAKIASAFEFERAFSPFLPCLRYIYLEQLAGAKS